MAFDKAPISTCIIALAAVCSCLCLSAAHSTHVHPADASRAGTALGPVTNGLTGDYCWHDFAHTACAGTRTCGTMNGGIYRACAYTASEWCYCTPESDPPCTHSAACERGERCVRHELAGGQTMCVSCASLAWFSFFKPVDVAASCGTGLSADWCWRHGAATACVGERRCASMAGGHYAACHSGLRQCYCIPREIPPCVGSQACQRGERCVIHKLAGDAHICASCASLQFFPFFVPVDSGDTCGATAASVILPSLGL